MVGFHQFLKEINFLTRWRILYFDCFRKEKKIKKKDEKFQIFLSPVTVSSYFNEYLIFLLQMLLYYTHSWKKHYMFKSPFITISKKGELYLCLFTYVLNFRNLIGLRKKDPLSRCWYFLISSLKIKRNSI